MLCLMKDRFGEGLLCLEFRGWPGLLVFEVIVVEGCVKVERDYEVHCIMELKAFCTMIMIGEVRMVYNEWRDWIR